MGEMDSALADAGAAPLLAVAVRRLTLTDFRCYAAARLDADARPLVLTGPNGAGKTNLLEAISFLAPGRGLRRARLSEVDRRGAGAWAVAAELEGPRGHVRIGTGRDAARDGAERRLVRIDGAPARGQTALAEHVNTVWLTPLMDRLFLEGASARRRFLDRLVFGFDADHAGRVAAYEYALRERGRLLRDGRSDGSWFTALEDTMARHGIAIAAARRDVTQRLSAACAEGAGPFPAAELALEGAVEGWLAEMPALAAEDRLRAVLAAGRRDDAATGGAGFGPHRADLAVRHLATGMPAAQCSTGEQKALLLSILLAHARLQAELRGAAPLLLLDEVAAHLDATRREALFGEILALRAQAWLTGTDRALFQSLAGSAQFVAVENATLQSN
jgi:DNA replication and repair protein RecF